MGAPEVTQFLTSLAVQDKVAASTQNQALGALLFLYREVLGVELPWLDDVVRAKRPQYLPVVLTRDDFRAVLQRLDGVARLMAILLYGAGLRLLECCRLRVKDVDFATNQIVIRDGKGHKDRVTMLPAAVKAALAAQIERVREQHQADLRQGAGWVELPGALARKYPNAGREWGWQWVFPATRFYVDRITGQRRRHHLPRIRSPAGGEGRGPGCRDRQAGHVPHLPALLRHPPVGGEPRHPYGPRAPRPPGREHHDDLYPRSQPGPGRRPEPCRPDVPLVMVARQSGLAAEAPVLPCSASLCSTASDPGRVWQRGGNSDAAGPPPRAAIVLYRTTQPDKAVQERSRSPHLAIEAHAARALMVDGTEDIAATVSVEEKRIANEPTLRGGSGWRSRRGCRVDRCHPKSELDSSRSHRRPRGAQFMRRVVGVAVASWAFLMAAAASAQPAGTQTLAEIRTTLREASALAAPVAEPLFLEAIAMAQARVGDVLGALQTAAGVADVFKSAGIVEAVTRVQVKAGDIRGARQTASSIRHNWVKAQALVSIAVGQAKGGDMAGAAQTFGEARGLAINFSPWDRVKLEQDIAAAQAEAGNVTAAQRTARAIPNDYVKAGALRRIMEVQIEAGDVKGALGTFTSIQEEAEKIRAAKEVAKAQARSGDVRGAQQTASRIAIPMFRALTLQGIALAQAEKGDVLGALQTAAGIGDDRPRAAGLTEIALAQAKAGDRLGAARTLEQAVQAVGRGGDANERAHSLGNIAVAQATTGDIAKALETAADLSHPYYQVLVLQAVAAARLKAGDRAGATGTLERALEVAAHAHPQSRDHALRLIAVGQTEAGDVQAALKTAERMPGGPAKASALRAIAAIQARAGDWRGALASAAGQKSPDVRALALLGAAEGALERIERGRPR